MTTPLSLLDLTENPLTVTVNGKRAVQKKYILLFFKIIIIFTLTLDNTL